MLVNQYISYSLLDNREGSSDLYSYQTTDERVELFEGVSNAIDDFTLNITRYQALKIILVYTENNEDNFTETLY